jgi:hypothetical protein
MLIGRPDRLLMGRPEGRTVGRTRRRWIHNIKIDLEDGE